MYKFVPNNCLCSMLKGNHKPNTIAQYAMKSTELRFCTHRNESNCVLGSKQLLSAQKNHLNETVLVPTKLLGLGENKPFILFCFLRYVTVMIYTFLH